MRVDEYRWTLENTSPLRQAIITSGSTCPPSHRTPQHHDAAANDVKTGRGLPGVNGGAGSSALPQFDQSGF